MQDADNPKFANASGHVVSRLFQFLSHTSRSFFFHERQLGVRVQVVIEFKEFARLLLESRLNRLAHGGHRVLATR
jgi:hypothetical protein